MGEKRGIEELTKLFNDARAKNANTSVSREMPRSRSIQDIEDNQEKVTSKGKTFKQSALGGIAIVAAGAVAFGAWYVIDGFQIGGPSMSSSLDLATAGHGKVESISMKIDPVTISTFETNVTGTKTEFEADFESGTFFGNFKVPVLQQSITRTTNVETKVKLAPDNVAIEWKPPKEGAKGDAQYGQLYFEVADAALSQASNVVVLPPNPSKKIQPTGTTDTGANAISMSSQQLASLASLVGSVFGGGASEVPLLNGVAKGNMSIETALENYSDLATTVNVGKACTKSVMGVPNFTDDLKKNVVPVAEGILLSNDPKVEAAVNKGIPTLDKMPVGTLKALLKHAIVLLPGETIEKPNAPTTMKVPSDETDIKALANYSKSQKVAMTVKQASSSKMTCDASDDLLTKNAKLGPGGGN